MPALTTASSDVQPPSIMRSATPEPAASATPAPARRATPDAGERPAPVRMSLRHKAPPTPVSEP
ncbi:MAG TPA: hypothetical protein VK279_13715, partial [Solirubrobacteraceae bacterium]|nr:hypothetical protein [Solirubrobacteraceae bacterium]